MAVPKTMPTLPDGLAHEHLRIADLESRLSKLQRLVDAQAEHNPIFATDPEGKIASWNQAAEKLYGYRAEEVLGRHLALLCFEEERACVGSTILQPLLRDGRLQIEVRQRCKSGAECFVRLCLSLLKGENGQPHEILAMATDITARKSAERLAFHGENGDLRDWQQIERELKESNKQLKFKAAILETTHDAVIALDTDLRVRYCNPAAERMYGVRLSEVVGKPLHEMHRYAFLAPEDEQRTISDLLERGSWKGEYIHILKDGTRVVVESTVNVLAPEAGGGMVAIIRDVTKRKQGEVSIENRGKQLARANEDLLHFAYAVSHDLQAPLRTVTSFSQLLALKYKSAFDDHGEKFLRYIVDASARLNTMLRDLLEFARVAGGETDFKRNVSLEEVLAIAVEGLRSSVEETAAVITHDPLPAVAADAGQFDQLFQNLIGNSLKYRTPGTPPRVHIAARQTGGEWVISVSDNGIGFDPKDSEKIFGVFQRLHGKEFAGTGIGLTICKRIVERRGGRIWAEGKPGEGATFSFSIPHSTEGIPVLPSMDWDRMHSAFENHTAPPEALAAGRHFDELFKTLDLAQAIVRDFDGAILIWTKGSQHLFGWTEAEALGRELHDLLGTEFPKSAMAIDAALLRDGEWTGELKARKKEGGSIWLASHAVLYRDGSGRPQSVIEIHNDITPLKQAEAALEYSSEQRDLALRAGQMGIWRWDSRTGAAEWSETIEGLLGMTPGSFEGTFEAFRHRCHPDDLRQIEQDLVKVLENRSSYRCECRLRRTDGSYCWVRTQGKVFFDELDQPAGLAGVLWDISEAKQNEADREFLLNLSSKLSQTSDQTELADLAAAEIARYLDVMRCVYSETDRARKQVHILADYHQAGPSALGTYARAQFEDLDATASNNRFVSVTDVETDPRTIKSCDSAYRPFGTRAFLSVPLHRAEEWVASLTVAADNVRHWQEREVNLLRGAAERLWPAMENARLLQQTKERQEQFESTFELAEVGLAHVALDGRWLRVNEQLCKITGYSRQDLLSGRFQEITHPDDLEDNMRQFEALKRGEITSYTFEKRYFHKCGQTIWVNLTAAIARDPSGEPKYVISVIEDITARKQSA